MKQSYSEFINCSFNVGYLTFLNFHLLNLSANLYARDEVEKKYRTLKIKGKKKVYTRHPIACRLPYHREDAPSSTEGAPDTLIVVNKNVVEGLEGIPVGEKLSFSLVSSIEAWCAQASPAMDKNPPQGVCYPFHLIVPIPMWMPQVQVLRSKTTD